MATYAQQLIAISKQTSKNFEEPVRYRTSTRDINELARKWAIEKHGIDPLKGICSVLGVKPL